MRHYGKTKVQGKIHGARNHSILKINCINILREFGQGGCISGGMSPNVWCNSHPKWKESSHKGISRVVTHAKNKTIYDIYDKNRVL